MCVLVTCLFTTIFYSYLGTTVLSFIGQSLVVSMSGVNGDKDKELVDQLRSYGAAQDLNLRQTTARTSSLAGDKPYKDNGSQTRRKSDPAVFLPSPLTDSVISTPSSASEPAVSTLTPSSISVPLPLSVTTPVLPRFTPVHNMSTPTKIKIDTKFCGNVSNQKDSDRYTNYTAQRWLTDTENRIASKSIQHDVDKIREARLAVHTEIGDAAAVINSVEMLDVKNWELFKKKCTLLWRTQSEQDSYLAIAHLLNVPYYVNSGDTISDLSKACDNVKKDILAKGKMKVAAAKDWSDRPEELLVSFREVFLHFNVGIIFNTLPPELKKTFRKVKWEYDDGLVEIMSKFAEQIAKSKTSVSKAINKTELACVALPASPSKQSCTMKQSYTGNQGKAEARNKFNKNSKLGSIRCFKCQKIGHIARNCSETASVCGFCFKPNHIESKCRQKASILDRKREIAATSCNMTTADESSDDESK